jgi:hypothetical protein
MSKLIFLNGAINCGKTTIGKKIAEKCENVAFVEIDDLHGFISWMPIEQAVPLNIKNGIDISKNFVKENIDVIFLYPLSDNDFDYVNSLIDFECQIKCITLYCELHENIKNRGNRELSEHEISRIKWMHENGLAKPKFSTIIDTTNKSINEIVETIISKLELRRINTKESA